MNYTIGVESPLELYTTIFGWHQYGNLWMVLTSTGLVFLPFVGMLIRNFIEPSQSQKANAASLTSLKRLEIDFIAALVIIMLAGQPLIPLKNDQLKFHSVCLKNEHGEFENKVVDINSDDSLYKLGNMHTTAKDTAIPVWWYAVLAFSSGFNNAAKVSLPCKDDVRTYTTRFEKNVIRDAELISEAQRFAAECYYPVRTFYYVTMPRYPDKYKSLDIHNFAKIEPDKEWMGWRPYMQSRAPYFYAKRRAKTEIIKDKITNTNRPATCLEWWDGSNNVQKPNNSGDTFYDGLRRKLRLEIYKNYTSRKECLDDNSLENCAVTYAFKESKYADYQTDHNMPYGKAFNYFMDSIIAKDIKAAIKAPEMPYQTHTSATPAEYESTIRKTATGVLGFVGSFFHTFVHYPMVHAVREAAPAVQAFILMSVYMLLPIVLIFSGYSIQFLTLAAVGIFSIKMWSYIFYLVFWIDQHLLEALTIEGATTASVGFTFGFVTSSMYFIFPTIFLSLMGWAGFKVGYGLQIAYDRLGGQSSQIAAAGQAGGKMGRGLVVGGAKAPLKAAGGAAKKLANFI